MRIIETILQLLVYGWKAWLVVALLTAGLAYLLRNVPVWSWLGPVLFAVIVVVIVIAIFALASVNG